MQQMAETLHVGLVAVAVRQALPELEVPLRVPLRMILPLTEMLLKRPTMGTRNRNPEAMAMITTM
jgi:hypothetical protein